MNTKYDLKLTRVYFRKINISKINKHSVMYSTGSVKNHRSSGFGAKMTFYQA
jgi:hypothetical protein